MTTAWKPEHLQCLSCDNVSVLPLYGEHELEQLSDSACFWDFWPVLTESGELAEVDGAELWMSLAAPIECAPDDRHHLARIRLHVRRDGAWQDCGYLLPDGYSLGSQEWSGSAIFTPESLQLNLYYTSVGQANRPGPSFEQRLVQSVGTLVSDATGIKVEDWRDQRESVAADGQYYAVADQVTGEPGFVTAFRDPYYFLDPKSGAPYLLFTGSMGKSETRYNGTIGIAVPGTGDSSPWQLCPPLITADGVNTEMERAHVIVHDELYYLFWSTQRHTFEPLNQGPNGLYGAVATSLTGPYRPLNGSGLVLSNPVQCPSQCYAWQVMPDLRVVSFIDRIQCGPIPHGSAGETQEKFIGTVSPEVHLILDGDTARLASSPHR